MYETGLETLLILIKNINEIKLSNGINIADPFYKTFYVDLLQEIFAVLTDSFHKSGFKLQVDILQHLIGVVEMNNISENLFDNVRSNKEFVMNYLVDLLSQAFTHLNKIQIEAFVLGLFNKCYSHHDFKTLIRDFLITLKSFAGNNEELFEEERKVKL
jgi:exportin-1